MRHAEVIEKVPVVDDGIFQSGAMLLQLRDNLLFEDFPGEW